MVHTVAGEGRRVLANGGVPGDFPFFSSDCSEDAFRWGCLALGSAERLTGLGAELRLAQAGAPRRELLERIRGEFQQPEFGVLAHLQGLVEAHLCRQSPMGSAVFAWLAHGLREAGTTALTACNELGDEQGAKEIVTLLQTAAHALRNHPDREALGPIMAEVRANCERWRFSLGE